MPIGDLLAEISGGNSSSAPKPAASSTPKRKAEDESQNSSSAKVAKSRQQDSSYSAGKAIRDVKANAISRPKSTPSVPSRPSLPDRTNSPSTNGRYEPPVPNGQRAGTSSTGRPLPRSSSNMAPQKQSSSSAPRPKLNVNSQVPASRAPAARPSPTTPTTSDPSRAPKKGSYQEIMERAKKAQANMGKVGMIQHKSLETSKKERTVKGEQKPGAAKGKGGKAYQGNGRPSGASTREAKRPGMASREGSRGDVPKSTNASSKQGSGSLGAQPLAKREKKSATATTGYTGTARPRPGAASRKPSSRKEPSSYKSGLLAPPKPSRRDRYEEEYDDEMDDFIDYDDEEDDPRGGGGGGYGYDSDASSDMEAGLSDIDVEERRAEKVAREEDRREQALEEKLKREKEERKRRLGR
ncbi:hypothetical protein GGR52DRAFT_449381 [Hypoxylon sp. FL1284]|nr:hypothetical protein GGR52DRAFT_449381 [Hypoxylon sp. FL1284]